MLSHQLVDSTGAAFAPVEGSGPGAVRHYEGLPLEIGHGDPQRTFPSPAAVLIEHLAKGGVLLTRLTADGEPVGDTWHEDVEAARAQAIFEYGTRVGEWKPIPHSRKDRETYVAERLREARSRGSESSSAE